MTNLGASLKKARESKGISLDQIASETRISTRFLAAIESEEFHLLPGGIFNRGFVRAFAEKVGLDPDQAVAEYERLAEVRPPEAVPVATPEPEKKKSPKLYPVAIGALLLLIVVFYVVTRESGRTAETASQTAPAASPTTNPAAPPPTPAPESSNPPVAVEPPPAAPEAAPANQTPAAAAPTPAPAPAAPSAQAITLELQAQQETWIKVVSDGTSVDPGEILAPGTSRKFTAQGAMQVYIGNAGGIVMKLNDKPMKPVGANGQVRQIKITPDTVKNFTE
jgi:cytoskeleton protein RodZ